MKQNNKQLLIGAIFGASLMYFAQKSKQTKTQTQQLYDGEFNEDFYRDINNSISNKINSY